MQLSDFMALISAVPTQPLTHLPTISLFIHLLMINSINACTFACISLNHSPSGKFVSFPMNMNGNLQIYLLIHVLRNQLQSVLLAIRLSELRGRFIHMKSLPQDNHHNWVVVVGLLFIQKHSCSVMLNKKNKKNKKHTQSIYCLFRSDFYQIIDYILSGHFYSPINSKLY